MSTKTDGLAGPGAQPQLRFKVGEYYYPKPDDPKFVTVEDSVNKVITMSRHKHDSFFCVWEADSGGVTERYMAINGQLWRLA